MLKRGLITLAAVSVLFAGSAFAGNKDDAGNMCKDKDVVGSYTRVIQTELKDGHGVFQERTWIRQLNLNAGGTVVQSQTSSFDFMVNTGIGSSWLGSWACRKDGKLLVTVLSANYPPIPADAYGPGSPADVVLRFNVKTTYLFSVEDNDTLKLIQAVARYYNMAQDPSDPDPSVGFLGTESFDEFFYDRLKPSDADLTP